jgi:ATP synthase protein I
MSIRVELTHNSKQSPWGILDIPSCASYHFKKERKFMSDDPALDALKKKIKNAQKEANPTPLRESDSQNLAGKFFNVGVELVAGVFVGAGLGLLFDWAFGTSPWGLISLFILGSAAGMLNVYRALTVKKPEENKKDTHV